MTIVAERQPARMKLSVAGFAENIAWVFIIGRIVHWAVDADAIASAAYVQHRTGNSGHEAA